MPTVIPLEPFEGPLDLLLRLIEQEEVDITAIALARVCEEYLAHLQQVEQRAPEEVADFLVVAAKLLYLKSLALVPGVAADSEDDATGLAEQLRIYRAFIDASRALEARYASGVSCYPTERQPIVAAAFLPPPRLNVAALRDAFARIIAELEPIVRIPHAVIGRVISIDDRITEIRQLIASQPHITLDDVLRGRTGSDQRIVSFLAILELVKQRVIEAEQAGRFAPIRIERIMNQESGIMGSQASMPDHAHP
ncbi:segregation/condensation protein A [Candidatus Uhrbacteria bacterium]|nr:segregation/condensation protein A [Candidatus Uhrbacteria bacterium]